MRASDGVSPDGGGPGAAASRRQLHTELQRLRVAAGFTQTEVAQAQEWSSSKVHRIEKGHVSVGKPDLLALLDHYGVEDRNAIDNLLELARLSRNQPMPFRDYRDVFTPEVIRFWAYEESASWIGEVEMLVVPGLLQTAEYTSALIRDGHGIDRDRTARFVQSRRERQKALDRMAPPTLSFVVDEAVLSRAVGGTDVMKAQLGHLVALAGRPNISIRVLPLTMGAHAGLRGPFVLLQFAAENDPDIVYIENRRGDSIFENDRAVTDIYLSLFHDLEKQAAPADDLELYVERVLDRL